MPSSTSLFNRKSSSTSLKTSHFPKALGMAMVGIFILSACAQGASEEAKPRETTTSTTKPSHGMTPEQMLCMKAPYAAANPGKCGGNVGSILSNALKVSANGLIDPASVNLSGVEGVSASQQKQSEDLLVASINTLPRWSDITVAVADGFQSIGDGGTGEEHLLHWDWIEDDTILDPNFPEALVYKVDRRSGSRTLEAAMYILPRSYTLESTPEIASPLVQFHQHDNLCFTQPPAARVVGLTNGAGECKAPLVKFNPNIQVHVWIRPNDCGPFAALIGIGAGQIKPGEVRSCVPDHSRIGF